MVKLSLQYLDTCTPDYFRGFAGKTYAINCEGKIRNGQLLKELITEIRGGELFGIQGRNAAEDAIVQAFIENPTQSRTDINGQADLYEQLCKSAIELFSTVDLRKRFADGVEGLYAYFGVTAEVEMTQAPLAA